MPRSDNVYAPGATVRLRAQFTDPATTTRLTARCPAGTTVLPVESGILGSGFAAASAVTVEGERLTVQTGGGTANSIPVSALPTTHQSGDYVALLVDPAAVTFKVSDPAGTVTTYSNATTPTVTKDGVGDYHLDVVPNKHGVWYWRAEGTGTYAGVAEGSFRVEASKFGG